ncbi:hypothetical protein O3M35_009720 [Rhynocoris fuscipes]|uniref:NADH dehydrogenase [ubiquinone] 1 alpha subcomplex subunit 1 n=1 Tax=Rhynocoris fuscipes TaxID=488301 RepID=A0AAW1D593_9HEMI
MWYEILPSFGIICGAVTIPSIFNYYFHKFIQDGNPYRRKISPDFNKDLFMRDHRLSGNPYVIQVSYLCRLCSNYNYYFFRFQ